MIRISELKVPVNHSQLELKEAIARRIQVSPEQILDLTIFKRSPDARKKNNILFVYTLDVAIQNEESVLKRFKKDHGVGPTPDTSYKAPTPPPSESFERPIIVGSGPAGFMAALILAQSGYRPLILERGKNARDRSRDTFRFWRNGILNPNSNVQFGEGGAGTFSDGKLNSQIKDPAFRARKVLTEFVQAGAPPEILFQNKPHVGTYHLIKMLKRIRRTILEAGGEYRFECRVDDILIQNGSIRGVITQSGEKIYSRNVILAIGHSARDTFQMLHEHHVSMEAKPFSVGFRIEHPQSHIDQCRYGSEAGNPVLGAADYKLVHHCENGRTVYSFCMCPGGSVVAATSELDRVVTNGMSQYSRSERNANSGLVVNVTPEDFPPGPLGGVQFQRELESKAFLLGGSNYRAPAQLVGDFLEKRPSSKAGSVDPSYKPGVTFTNLEDSLPPFAIDALREAIPQFDRQIRGFAMDDAILTGVETRTSSPLRILRNRDTLESENVEGLFPAGEGAGYAGGIMSAAVDGIRVAEKVAGRIHQAITHDMNL